MYIFIAHAIRSIEHTQHTLLSTHNNTNISNSYNSNPDLCKNTDLFDVNELAKCCNETLEFVINRHAPLTTKTIVARPHVPWFNNEVKCAKILS